jgi:GAF domain-containing protein
MNVLGRTPDGALASAGALTARDPADATGVPGPAGTQPGDPAGAVVAEPFERVARLAAIVLGTPLAAVTIAGESASFAGNSPGAPGVADWQSPSERALCLRVIDSGENLILGGTRLDLRMSGKCLARTVCVVAWAGFPVRGPDGRVAGALCVADRLPRNWTGRDVEALETLAQVAGREVALQAALRQGAERAALAQTLQESLLPRRRRHRRRGPDRSPGPGRAGGLGAGAPGMPPGRSPG